MFQPTPPPTPAKKPAKLAADTIERTLKPIKRDAFGFAQARHLLWRAGFGGDETQIGYLVDAGPEKAVDLLLDIEKTPYEAPKIDAFDKDIMRPATAEERTVYRAAQQSQNEEALAAARLERQRREQSDRRQMGEVQKWWVKRMIETPRPLEEKMTLFWHGLLATNYRTIENSYHMYVQNQLFRTHALGSYAELLAGLIRDPAMIAYLDNNDSRKGRPNENLAREIMELFSLGVGNYTERDIKEGARALTGYTFEDDEFRFQRNNHDTGGKTILGQSGNWDGDGFVRIILEQPACSKYVARRLYSYFVADVPSDERGGDKGLEPAQRQVLGQLASLLSQGRYQIKPVLRKLFLSEHFYEERFMNDQIKSPVVLVVGAVRSLNTPVRDLSILNDALDLMGQRVFYPPSVKGWEGGRAWLNTSTFYVRQNTLAFLVAGKKPQGFDGSAKTDPYDARTLLKKPADEAGTVAEALLRVGVGWVPAAGKASLVEFARVRGKMDLETVNGMLLLVTAMPEYQLC